MCPTAGWRSAIGEAGVFPTGKLSHSYESYFGDDIEVVASDGISCSVGGINYVSVLAQDVLYFHSFVVVSPEDRYWSAMCFTVDAQIIFINLHKKKRGRGRALCYTIEPLILLILLSEYSSSGCWL